MPTLLAQTSISWNRNFSLTPVELATLPETKSKRPWKWMVGRLISFWDGPISGANCWFQGGYLDADLHWTTSSTNQDELLDLIKPRFIRSSRSNPSPGSMGQTAYLPIHIPWKSAKCGWICVNISYVDPMGNATMHRVLFKSSAIAGDNKINRANATCWRFLEKSHHGAQNKPLMSSVVSAKHGKTWGLPVPLYHGWDWPLSGLVDLTQAGVS